MNLRGWSLIEVLIAITVAALAGGLIISLMVSSSRLFVDESAQISHGLSLNQSQLELTELIKSSAGIVNQYPISGTPQYSADSNTLIAKLPAINASGNIIDSVYDYAVVEADSDKPQILRKKVFKDNQSYRKAENKVLSTSLKTLNFSYLNLSNGVTTPDQAVRVSFIINLSTKSGFSEKVSSGSGTVNLKNL